MSLVWCNLGLIPGLPDHWRILYQLDEWTGSNFLKANLKVANPACRIREMKGNEILSKQTTQHWFWFFKVGDLSFWTKQRRGSPSVANNHVLKYKVKNYSHSNIWTFSKELFFIFPINNIYWRIWSLLSYSTNLLIQFTLPVSTLTFLFGWNFIFNYLANFIVFVYDDFVLSRDQEWMMSGFQCW